MKTIEDWQTVSNIIDKALNQKNIFVKDIFLVGSRAKNNYKIHSDFDNLIILHDNNFTLDDLRKIKFSIDVVLNNFKLQDIYHFKLFSLHELNLACNYDGFRIADFKNHHISLKTNKILEELNPCLNLQNFINSFLIQVIYNYCKYIDDFNFSLFYDTLNYWVKFNNEIFPIFRHLKSFEEIVIHDALTSEIWKILHLKDDFDRQQNIKELLPDYYLRVRHEYVNKSKYYLFKIDSKSSLLHESK